MSKQIFVSIIISLAVTTAVNLFIYAAFGSFEWHNFLFFGLLFGLTFPLSKKFKRGHRG